MLDGGWPVQLDLQDPLHRIRLPERLLPRLDRLRPRQEAPLRRLGSGSPGQDRQSHL